MLEAILFEWNCGHPDALNIIAFDGLLTRDNFSHKLVGLGGGTAMFYKTGWWKKTIRNVMLYLYNFFGGEFHVPSILFDRPFWYWLEILVVYVCVCVYKCQVLGCGGGIWNVLFNILRWQIFSRSTKCTLVRCWLTQPNLFWDLFVSERLYWEVEK